MFFDGRASIGVSSLLGLPVELSVASAARENEMGNVEWYQLYSDSEPIIQKELLNKILSNGSCATFALVRHEGEYKAMLYVNGKKINGPALPQLLSSPKDDVTHWMGNKPGVGLTSSEAEMIIQAVTERNERSRDV